MGEDRIVLLYGRVHAQLSSNQGRGRRSVVGLVKERCCGNSSDVNEVLTLQMSATVHYPPGARVRRSLGVE